MFFRWPFAMGIAITFSMEQQQITPEEVKQVEGTDVATAPQKAATALVKVPVSARSDGTIVPDTLEGQIRLARYYHASGIMPQGLSSPEKILVALQLLFELKLPPITNIGKVCVVNGTASIFGDLPLGLAWASGKMEDFAEMLLAEDGRVISVENGNLSHAPSAAVCRARRKGSANEVIRAFTIQDAEIAGLWKKKSSSGKPTPWVLYPKRMLQMRARSWCLKDTVPDVLGGVSILEYDHNAMMDDRGTLIGEVTEMKDISGELNAKYLEKTHEASGETEQV